MCEIKTWQAAAERHYEKIAAYLERHCGEYPPEQSEELYDGLVTALIRTAHRFAPAPEELFSAELEREFGKALQRLYGSMGRKARIQLISFSDPLLREETTAGMEQWYEYDACEEGLEHLAA